MHRPVLPEPDIGSGFLHKASVSGAAAAIALLGGCSVGTPLTDSTQQLARARHSQISQVATNSKLLYIARYSYRDVQVYDSRTLAHIGAISGFTNPRGLAVDSRRNVYVVDQGLNTVEVFHRGKTLGIPTSTRSRAASSYT